MSGGGGGTPQDFNHAHQTNLDYAHAAHTGFQGIQTVAAPFTWLDLSDPAYWIPVAPFGQMGSLAVSPAGAVLHGNNVYAGGQLGALRYGVASRGRFYPDINSELDVTVFCDQYIPGDDISHTRFYRAYMALFLEQIGADSHSAMGLMHGTDPSVGPGAKEITQLMGEGSTWFATSEPTQLKDLSGQQSPVADNSTIAFRLKLHWATLAAGTIRTYLYHAQVDLNGGAGGGGVTWGGALADADKQPFANGLFLAGLKLFAGAYASVISARFKLRVVSVTLNAGVYAPF